MKPYARRDKLLAFLEERETFTAPLADALLELLRSGARPSLRHEIVSLLHALAKTDGAFFRGIVAGFLARQEILSDSNRAVLLDCFTAPSLETLASFELALHRWCGDLEQHFYMACCCSPRPRCLHANT